MAEVEICKFQWHLCWHGIEKMPMRAVVQFIMEKAEYDVVYTHKNQACTGME